MFVLAEAELGAPEAGGEERPLADVEVEMCELSASIAAAQGRLAGLLGEFMERGGADAWGVTPARWVAWKLGLGTAESHRLIALAQRLPDLPYLAAACEDGRVSASLAGTIARAATPATERELVDLADGVAPGKVERVCRTKARLDAQLAEEAAAAAAGEEPPSEPPAPSPGDRYVQAGCTDDGLGWELHAGLRPVEGARFELALDRAMAWLRGAGSPPYPELVEAVRPTGRRPTRADALLLLAETLLAAGPRERQAADRHQVVVHIEVERLRAVLNGDLPPGAPVATTAAGGTVDAGTVAGLMCDSRLIGLLEEAGRPVRIGDPTSAVPAHIRRAVLARDGHMCAHPTCGATRGLEIHHVIHRADGGDDDPDLLVTLCWGDHDARHRGAFEIVPTEVPGRFRFILPDGTEITARTPRAGPAVPIEQLGLPDIDRMSANNRPYGGRLTRWALAEILEHLFRLDQQAADKTRASPAA